jgi:hypothetical protein
MKISTTQKQVLFYASLFAGLFIYLQIKCKWHFFFIEQNQLFQHTTEYISSVIMQFGGPAIAISQFLVQFNIYMYAGAAVTAVLLTAVGWLTGVILRRASANIPSAMLSLIPVVALILVHFDFNYMYSGTVAIVMVLTAVALVFAVKNTAIQRAAHPLTVIALAFASGPAFMLYAAIAIAYEAIAKRSLRDVIIISASAIIAGLFIIGYSIAGELRFAFLPDLYYHDSLRPKSVIYFSWIAIVLIFILSYLLKNRKLPSLRRLWIERALLLAFAAGFLYFGAGKYQTARAEQIKEFDYYSRTEQWNKILEQSKGSMANYLLLNYANLALANTGQLADRMFAYAQHGPLGLLSEWDKTAPVSVLHSDIYFALNLIAPSQEKAFEAYASAMSGGNPRMLLRLVETNLIYGSYPVAEKYIDILSSTIAYRRRASEYKKLLNNDSAVESHPLLGPKRRSLPATLNLGFMQPFDAELRSMADSNSSDTTSIIYSGLWSLLCKDMASFKSLIETYAGSKYLAKLPIPFQEAVILLAENDPAYWQRFAISDQTVSRFMEFKKQVVAANRSNNSASLPRLLQGAFGATYWYYYLFGKV